jgi:hypothetical protein
VLRENETLPTAARLSIRAIYEHIRDTEGFRGGYNTVRDYVRSIAPDKSDGACIWEDAYNLVTLLGKKRGIKISDAVIPRGTSGHFEKPRRTVFPRC